MSKLKFMRAMVILAILSFSLGGLATKNTSMVEGSCVSNFRVREIVSNQVSPPAIYGSNGETIGIIVDPAMMTVPILVAAVNQYVLDLNMTGYNVLLDTTGAASAVLLKNKINNWYSTYGISGVALIGNLPYAQFYHPANPGAGFASAETFICDLFLTDLDGNWTDSEPDGVYDIHNDGTGDIEPEIYLGRIDSASRTLGGLTHSQDIINVLGKIHAYYVGVNIRNHQALTDIDDDWQSWADGTFDNWPGWLDNAYSTRTDVHTPATWTNATDWLSRMTQDYEWTHLAAHSGSSPAQHYFGPGGVGEGIVTNAQIHAASPASNFYNLFCCSGADFSAIDCLATTYLFSGSHAIGVIGTTKTGGMLSGTNFYNSIGFGSNTIGQGLLDWFQFFVSYSPASYLEWFYGMTILGDPFATTVHDQTIYQTEITSSTHPTQGNWYNTFSVQFNWSEPADVSGIYRYYYVIDQNPTTNPTTSDTFTTQKGVQTTLTEGTHYLHVIVEDNAGNIANTVHFEVKIDATAPVVSITNPTDGGTTRPGVIELTWTLSDAMSGIDQIAISQEGVHYLTINEEDTSTDLTLEEGTYTFEVTVFDNAGLSAVDSVTFEVQNFFKSTTFYIIVGAGSGTIALIVVIIIIVVVRKKKV
ncbi:MAG: Ig-like domain-containing protein [Candidatus Heimdallarchaeota archaeon]